MPFFLRGRTQKEGKPKKKLVKRVPKQTGFAPSKKRKEIEADRNDEEITSEEDDDFMEQFKKKKEDTIQYLQEEEETPQEKKVRLAKQYLEEIKQQKEEELEDEADLDHAIGRQLREDVLETAGKLQKSIADSIAEPSECDISLHKCNQHKLSLTCLRVSQDEKYIFTASKDCNIVKWSINGEKLGVILGGKRGKERSDLCHGSHVLCMALCTDGKFLVSGDVDGIIHVWDPIPLTHLKSFTKHKGAISGLAFRRGSHNLFSASHDRMVMLWDLDSMTFVENMGGHQDAITGIDVLHRESCITCGGRDNTVIVNIIAEEKQLRFVGFQDSIDGVKLINEKSFITYGQDGSLASWTVTKRKPQHIVRRAHGVDYSNKVPHWITAIGAVTNTDLVASGSLDGMINMWKVDRKSQKFIKLFSIPVSGVVNGIEFTPSGSHLIAIVGKEHKLGRWFSNKDAKNALVIIALPKKS